MHRASHSDHPDSVDLTALYSTVRIHLSSVALCLFLGHPFKSWNHRMVSVGRDLKNHHVPTPCYGQEDTLSLDEVAQSFIHPDLEHFQRCDIHNFSEQRVPVPPHPQSE